MRKCIANTYEIVARIGSGNSGIVYKAYHKNLNKYVVLKKVKEDIKDLVNARAEVDVLTASEFGADKMDAYDAVAFGCPAMGAEELEDSEFEPMFSDCEGKLGGKKIALFGSYGWGDGEWMRTWEETCKADGAVLACESVLANEAPDDDAVAACQALGKALC